VIAVLALVAAVIAEALAFYCGAEIFANGYREDGMGQHAPAALTFAIVGLVGLGLPRLGDELALSRRNSYLLAALISAVVFYAALRIEFAGDLKLWDWAWVADFLSNAEQTARDSAPAVFGGAFLALCFARAIWRGGADLELEYLPRSLSIPLVVVLLFVVFGAGSDRAAVIGRGAAAFFTFAVVAMALSQAALSGATFGNLRAGGVTGILLAWTGIATVVGLLVFGVILGLVGEQIGSLVYTVLQAVVYVILTPIAWVLVWFFDLIIPDTVLTEEQLQDLPEPLLGGEDGEGELEEEEGDPAWQRLLLLVMRLGVLGLVLAVLAGLFVLVIRLRRRGALRRTGDVTVSASGSFGADLMAGVRGLFSREQAVPVSQPEGIYRLYGEVLGDADRRGAHRQPGQTPEEFMPSLTQVYHTHLTDEITAAFEQARYAGREVDPRLVADLRIRWEQSRHLQPET
jgi:hypothetical protein